MQGRSARTTAVAAGGLVLSAVVLACCLVGSLRQDELFQQGGRGARQQQLAYDGMYDTPPVTWYYPAGSSNENTLGYTWNNAEMQNTAVTYEPGMMTDHGIAHTTEDTIGFATGETTTAYPFGTGIEYQNQVEMYSGLASKRPLHPATLKFIKARDQSLADITGVDDMEEALKSAKGKDIISGKEDLLTKKLDAAFDAINGDGSEKLVVKPGSKSYSDMDEEMEDMRLSDDLLDAADSTKAKGRRGRKSARGIKIARKGQQLYGGQYQVDPYQVDPNAPTSAKVEVNGDTAMQMSYASNNIAGPATVNLAKSDDTSGPHWSTQGDVQMQSPALLYNQLPPPLPAPGPMMHMPMYPGQPPYSFHVNHGGYPPSVKGEIWSYSDTNGNSNGVCARTHAHTRTQTRTYICNTCRVLLQLPKRGVRVPNNLSLALTSSP